MKLTYRAVEHDYQPVLVESADAGVKSYYRGQAVHYTYPRHIPQPVMTTYRGVPCPTAGGAETRDRRPAAAQSVPTPVVYSSKRQMEAAAEAHRQTIRQRLQHRIQVAIANGDEDLLYQLQREMQVLA